MGNPDMRGYTPKQDNQNNKQGGKFVVGARTNPDGTLDLSRAAEYRDPEGELTNKFDEAEERKKQERAEKLEIPSDVKLGTSEMTRYDLRNTIFINEESLKENPNDKRMKELNSQFKAEQAMLDNGDLKRKQDLMIKKEAESKGEKLSAEQILEKSKNYSALQMAELIHEHFIDQLQKEAEGGKEFSSLLSEKIDNFEFSHETSKLLKAANDLESRLYREHENGISWDKKHDKEKILKTEDAKKIAEIREKIRTNNFTAEKTPEREKTREQIINKVLENGGFRVHMALAEGVAKRKKAGGFQSMEERIKDGKHPSHALGNIESQIKTDEDNRKYRGLREIMSKEARNINEIVDIRHEEKPQYESVKISGKKGILGIGQTPDREERRATGRNERVMHSEIVENGKKEPAIRITYFARNEDWRVDDGRKGQEMVAEFVIPESIAKEVEQEIAANPSFIRNLTERIVKEKLLNDSKEFEKSQVHGDSIRPPYEKWDAAEGGGRIYVQKEGSASGWHEEFVKKVKK